MTMKAEREPLPTLAKRKAYLGGDALDSLAAEERGFLADVQRLNLTGAPDEALDVIFDRLDEWILADNFAACDRILSTAQLQGLDPSNVLGFLTITFAARERLEERKRYFERAERELLRRMDKTEAAELLAGLEG